MFKSELPVPQNVTLFGSRIFAAITNLLKMRSLEWALIHYGFIKKRNVDTDTHRKKTM